MAYLKEKRQEVIQKLLEEHGQVQVAGLSQIFAVSEMTIRRDLQEMSTQGVIERTHGGALLKANMSIVELPIVERSQDRATIKERIAEATASMIQPHETVFLGSGSTVFKVAQKLSHRPNLTIVTNALNIANTLVTSRNISVIVVGGMLRHSEMSLTGNLAESVIRKIHVDKVIMGTRGIHPEYGLTHDNMAELTTDQAILGTSDNVIIVADYTKFGYVAMSRTAPITAVTTIVTDTLAPADTVEAIRSLGVTILQV